MLFTLARGVDASDWTKEEITASIHTLTDLLAAHRGRRHAEDTEVGSFLAVPLCRARAAQDTSPVG